MIRSLLALSPREFAKWCAYILVLLAPGSFIVIAAWSLVRLVAAPREGD